VTALYSVNSDGYQHDLFVDRPFFALDSRWAGGADTTDDLRVDPLYDRGNIIDEFQEHDELARIYGGFSHGLDNGWVTRWTFGFTSDDRQFERAPLWGGVDLVPADRKLVFPWVRYELVQDDYLKYHNYNEIDRTEDFYLGTHLLAQLGWSDPVFGANIAGLMFSANGGIGWATEHNETLVFAGTLDGRLQNGSLENTVVDAELPLLSATVREASLLCRARCRGSGAQSRPRRPDPPGRRQRTARLSAALSGRHLACAPDARGALLQRLVSAAAAAGGCRRIRRPRAHLGQRARSPSRASGS
jgi:hypothetical protein